jgi:hypothetical protein
VKLLRNKSQFVNPNHHFISSDAKFYHRFRIYTSFSNKRIQLALIRKILKSSSSDLETSCFLDNGEIPRSPILFKINQSVELE